MSDISDLNRMSMGRFLRLDRLTALLTGLVALATYLLTIDPSASYWDCPEYVAVADKLLTGHPPGNPMWMLAARFMVNFAPDVMHKALAVNLLSAVTTALAAAILCRTATLLLTGRWLGERKMRRRGVPLSRGWLSLSAGAAGGLALAWSDSVWFSAVEAEVYAFSLLLTALAIWLTLLWGAKAGTPHADRYLILVAFITGAGMGVHELNLLSLPTVALIIGYRTRRPGAPRWRSWAFLAGGCLLVILLLKGFLPLVFFLGGQAELLAVNRLGLPFSTGLVTFWLLLLAALTSAAIALQQSRRFLRALCLSCWALLMFCIGFSCYALVLIRSNANPFLNVGSPDNIFSFRAYYERDQYGSTPLLHGPVFGAPRLIEVHNRPDGSHDLTHYRNTHPRATYAKGGGGSVPPVLTSSFASEADKAENARLAARGSDCYFVTGYSFRGERVPEMCVWFPRMYSNRDADVTGYEGWGGLSRESMTPITDATLYVDPAGHRVDIPGHEPDTLYRPTLLQNLRYFAAYQISYMYLRYLWWNFAGRHNDLTGSGEPDGGLPATGIGSVDALFASPAEMPADIAEDNPGHNIYYFIPLIFGIAGAASLLRRGRRGKMADSVIASLFFFTGMAIVIYLNQPPTQARDRDYSFLGSWYAFCIWIGAAAFPLFGALRRLAALRLKMTRKTVRGIVAASAALTLLVPVWILTRTTDDHDRSNRSAVSDMARNTLASVPRDAILFLDTDNSVFPAIYAQSVEEVRRDVFVVNMPYLSMPDYVARLGLSPWGYPGLRLTVPQGWLLSDRLAYVELPVGGDWMDASEALRQLYSSEPDADRVYAKMPTSRVLLPLGRDTIRLDLREVNGGSGLMPFDMLATLDIIASNLSSPKPRAMAWDAAASAPFQTRLRPFMRRCGVVWILDPDGSFESGVTSFESGSESGADGVPSAQTVVETSDVSSVGAKPSQGINPSLRLPTPLEALKMARNANGVYRWGMIDPNRSTYFDPLTASRLTRFRIELVKAAMVLSRDPKRDRETLRLVRTIRRKMPAHSIPWTGFMLPDSTYTDEGAELALAMLRVASRLNPAAASRVVADSLLRDARALYRERLADTRRYWRYRHALPKPQRKFVSDRTAALSNAHHRVLHLPDSFPALR